MAPFGWRCTNVRGKLVWNKVNPVSALNVRPHLGGRACVVIGNEQQLYPDAERAHFPPTKLSPGLKFPPLSLKIEEEV